MPQPSMRRLRFSRRSTGWLVVGIVVLVLGSGATAVTAEFQASSGLTNVTTVIPPAAPTNAADTGPSISVTPYLRKPTHLTVSSVLVTRRNGLSRHQLHRLAHLSGVHRTQPIRAGTATVDGHRAFVVGVNPQTFRPWTPKVTADSNSLWASVDRGDLTASFDMGHDAKLPLGQSVSVDGRAGVTPFRIGAFASVGLAGVDAVVSSARARQIGLASHSGVLLSAPHSNPLTVRKAALRIAGRHGHAEVLSQVTITRDAGEFLTVAQISGFLHAAASRVGAPYVWGAAGPRAFDCSGLVQWSFARVGVTMPRVAQEQFFTGPHVPYSDARPGDLLFWHYDPTDRSDIDHVAIYAGKGMMLVAPHTGLDVEYVPVPLNELAGVVRVDPKLAASLA